MKDYYDILGLDKNCTKDDVKSAYRKAAKKYHPDLNPGDSEAEAKFKEVTTAYEVLYDEELRIRYDRYGEAGVQGAAAGDYGAYNDIFSDIFDLFNGSGGFGGFGYGARRRQGPVRGENHRYDLTIDFNEAVFGTDKEIEAERYETCEACSGTGAKDPSKVKTCDKCNGTGEVHYRTKSLFGDMISVGTCDKCGGSGKIFEEKCKECDGDGKILKKRKIKIHIPEGVYDGSVMKLRGEGGLGEKGGAPGDLYVYISVRGHEVFKRQGNDIFMDIPITFTEACLGAELAVPGLKGEHKFEMPKGTQTGTTFKIAGMGVKDVNSKRKGDLYFRVNIQVPTDLDEKQEEFLRELAKNFGEKHKEVKKSFFEKVKEAFN